MAWPMKESVPGIAAHVRLQKEASQRTELTIEGCHLLLQTFGRLLAFLMIRARIMTGYAEVIPINPTRTITSGWPTNLPGTSPCRCEKAAPDTEAGGEPSIRDFRSTHWTSDYQSSCGPC